MARFPGVRDPDLWQVAIEDSEDTYAFVTEPEAQAHAKNVRKTLLDEWRQENGDEDDLSPSVTVEPVWIGDPRLPERRGN